MYTLLYACWHVFIQPGFAANAFDSASLHALLHVKFVFTTLLKTFVGYAPPSGPPKVDNTDVFTKLQSLALEVQWLFLWLGVIGVTIGISIAALLRSTALGSERRIMISNAAIACAIIGLLVLLLANPLTSFLSNVFGSDLWRGVGQ